MKLATSIDEVIEILDQVIEVEVKNKSALAFFPVLYKKVTERIRDGIQQKNFEDNPRMERLDVLFANRYLEAYYSFKKGDPITQSWQHTFIAAQDNSLLILQHILLGINAHINLDLGIVSSQTVGLENPLAPFKNDYDAINDILSTMVNSMQASINKVSPLLILVEIIGKGKEDKLAAFSINLARDGSWIFANKYHAAPDKTLQIQKRDANISILAVAIGQIKSKILKYTVKIVRFFETKNVKKVVASLEKA